MSANEIFRRILNVIFSVCLLIAEQRKNKILKSLDESKSETFTEIQKKNNKPKMYFKKSNLCINVSNFNGDKKNSIHKNKYPQKNYLNCEILTETMYNSLKSMFDIPQSVSIFCPMYFHFRIRC